MRFKQSIVWDSRGGSLTGKRCVFFPTSSCLLPAMKTQRLGLEQLPWIIERYANYRAICKAGGAAWQEPGSPDHREAPLQSGLLASGFSVSLFSLSERETILLRYYYLRFFPFLYFLLASLGLLPCLWPQGQCWTTVHSNPPPLGNYERNESNTFPLSAIFAIKFL